MITALSAEQLALERGGRRLFSGLSFDLRAGEALALTGPNGAGKTSLLRAVAGLLRPAEGGFRFTGGGGGLSPREARAGGLHWLGAQDGLKSARSAEAELRFWSGWTAPVLHAARAGGGPRKGSDVAHALDALGLLPHAAIAVRHLSSGQRRRLALARLLAQPRPVWLLDEPLAPLDAGWRARVGALMQTHLDGGGLILAAVHDPLPVPARELALA